ncbi:B3 domain-containing transcription factor NGA4-like [Tripterygium wilfordii]|uniref:B3 domain-containing transcription factor NGA4-like n=1 Tax=Tripterygium wilfordii TaxID=458696 RepID=A0A7J7D5N8_TRIWF|nr:B3 domain-containing transcription factor NGA4-like [Tripterygium wilfordii]
MAAQPQRPNIDNQVSMILLFSIILGKSAVNFYRQSFPTKFLALLFLHASQVLQGGHAAEIEVWDVKKQKLRKFVCRTRREKYPKPVLSGRNWRGFIQENKLKVGDRILFFKQVAAGDHGVRFGIDVERATTNIVSAGTSTTNVVSLITAIASGDN